MIPHHIYYGTTTIMIKTKWKSKIKWSTIIDLMQIKILLCFKKPDMVGYHQKKKFSIYWKSSWYATSMAVCLTWSGKSCKVEFTARWYRASAVVCVPFCSYPLALSKSSAVWCQKLLVDLPTPLMSAEPDDQATTWPRASHAIVDKCVLLLCLVPTYREELPLAVRIADQHHQVDVWMTLHLLVDRLSQLVTLIQHRLHLADQLYVISSVDQVGVIFGGIMVTEETLDFPYFIFKLKVKLFCFILIENNMFYSCY